MIFKKNKSILPNYGVFDEKRYFSVEENKESLFQYKNKKIKFLICEEMWSKDYMLQNKKKQISLSALMHLRLKSINLKNEKNMHHKMLSFLKVI